MGSGAGGRGEGDAAFSIPMVDWDPIAEDELRAIEEEYATTKRRNSDPGCGGGGGGDDFSASDPRPNRRRRLPRWANASASPSRSPTVDRGVRNCDSRRNGLWTLAPPQCQANPKLQYLAMNFEGSIVYCRTAPEVEQAAMELFNKIKATKQNADQISLGFDIEWRPTFRRGEAPRKAAVMQICMDTSHCYVMHIIHTGIPPILKSLLEDCSSVKVGVCVAGDAIKISRDYNVSVESLEDLSMLANLKLGGAPKRWSLSSLTEALTCKQLAKPGKIRMGNWEAKVLSKEQLQYAATDAFVSWYLHQVLNTFPNAKSENEDKEKATDAACDSKGSPC